HAPSASPPPSSLPFQMPIGSIAARDAVQRSSFLTVFGSKIVLRRTNEANAVGPIGIIDLSAPNGRTPGVAVAGMAPFAAGGSRLLAQGADETANGRIGTWAYSTQSTQARAPAVFLGTSTAFCPSVDGETAWLTDGATARQVSISDASMLAGPYPLDGRLVASVGGGLLLQRGSAVVWWVPGTPGESRMVGSGTALAGAGEYILWQGPDGLVNVSDPNTRQVAATAVRLRPGQNIGAAALSPGVVRVAVVAGRTLTIGDTFRRGRPITVALGPIGDIAWLDDETVLARVGATGLIVVDATTGVIVHEPDLAYNSLGFALLPVPNR
ncbi:MAG: hypothetical protein M3N98_14915, partial [Actinomycetota bacterium]|nr:hypothetical protein [Actinomycetota bacterium]